MLKQTKKLSLAKIPTATNSENDRGNAGIGRALANGANRRHYHASDFYATADTVLCLRLTHIHQN